mmetsp:Transcript_16600/g.48832  ORF Transcript_16600/g.48832 Transcript_16600/m.48832 type:complete len:503 (+) Transcript_16600:853-2361(+)
MMVSLQTVPCSIKMRSRRKYSLFFDIVDALFLNYWWNPEALQRSKAAARKRALDVYAGIDVFGRGTYGGGGMTCGKAVEAIRQAGVSCAVFAPGWVFEDAQFDKKAFDANSAKFWAQFEDGTFQRRPLSGLPWATTFCAGSGDVFAIQGEVVRKDRPWAWLTEQTIHPTEPSKPKINPYFPILKDNASAADTFAFAPPFLDYKHPYDGGSCLAIRGAARVTERTLERQDRAVFKLFVVDLPLSNPVCVSFTYSTKRDGPRVNPDVVLVCTTPSGSYQYLTLHCESVRGVAPLPQTPEEAALAGKLAEKYSMAPSRCIRRSGDSVGYMSTKEAGPATFPDVNGWRTATFVLCDQQLKPLTVREIRLNLSVAGQPTEKPAQVGVDIGALRLYRLGSTLVMNAASKIHVSSPTWRKDAFDKWRFDGVLEWTIDRSAKISFFDVWLEAGEEWAFVGRTFTDRLFFSDILLPRDGSGALRFAVQSCNAALCRLPLPVCPTLLVQTTK